MLAWCRGTSSTSRTQTTEEIISAAGTIFHSRMSTYFGGKSIRPPKKAKHLWCHPPCIWKMAPAACFSHTWRWFAICGISSKPVHPCSVSDLSCFFTPKFPRPATSAGYQELLLRRGHREAVCPVEGGWQRSKGAILHQNEHLGLSWGERNRKIDGILTLDLGRGLICMYVCIYICDHMCIASGNQTRLAGKYPI